MTTFDNETANGAGGADEAVTPEDDAMAILKADAAALKEQALRYAAEAENTRRRAEREVNDARAYAISKFAKDLLGVADNLASWLGRFVDQGSVLDPSSRHRQGTALDPSSRYRGV